MCPGIREGGGGGARGWVVEDGSFRRHDLAEGEDGGARLGRGVHGEEARAAVGARIVRREGPGQRVHPHATLAQVPRVHASEPTQTVEFMHLK